MIIPLLAELNGLEISGLICGMIFGGGAFIVALIALFRKSDTQISPQPLDVNIIKSLHEQFASKEAFEAMSDQNRDDHDKLFKRIGSVERNAIERIDTHIDKLQNSAEIGREKIHKRLNRISIGLASICGRLDVRMPSEEEET